MNKSRYDVMRVLTNSKVVNNSAKKTLFASSKNFQNNKIELELKNKVKLLQESIKVSDNHINYNANEHEQYHYIHHQGGVSRNIIQNVQKYHENFKKVKKNDKVRSNALRYIKNINKKLEYHPPARYSEYMNINWNYNN